MVGCSLQKRRRDVENPCSHWPKDAMTKERSKEGIPDTEIPVCSCWELSPEHQGFPTGSGADTTPESPGRSHTGSSTVNKIQPFPSLFRAYREMLRAQKQLSDSRSLVCMMQSWAAGVLLKASTFVCIARQGSRRSREGELERGMGFRETGPASDTLVWDPAAPKERHEIALRCQRLAMEGLRESSTGTLSILLPVGLGYQRKCSSCPFPASDCSGISFSLWNRNAKLSQHWFQRRCKCKPSMGSRAHPGIVPV